MDGARTPKLGHTHTAAGRPEASPRAAVYAPRRGAVHDDSAADAEALARAEGKSLNETVELAQSEAVERRRKNPAFRRRVRDIIEQDRELLERLAK